MNWIVAGVSGNAADANGEGADSSASLSPDLDAPSAVCGLAVGSLFEVVRAHEALRGRWRVVKIDRGPRGTPRVWARQPASTDYLPLTEPQIEDALQHGWLLIVRKRASSKAPPRPG
ncbi:MAG: hypothetical protein H6703_02300 [Myxococcales bacterium]|nr:hypothetical protein [Myxococcales bacterium]